MMRNTTEKVRGAILWAVVFAALFAACIAAVLLDWGAWWEKALCVGILAPFVVGVLLALRQRLKEIKGGEEDAASQY